MCIANVVHRERGASRTWCIASLVHRERGASCDAPKGQWRIAGGKRAGSCSRTHRTNALPKPAPAGAAEPQHHPRATTTTASRRRRPLPGRRLCGCGFRWVREHEPARFPPAIRHRASGAPPHSPRHYVHLRVACSDLACEGHSVVSPQNPDRIRPCRDEMVYLSNFKGSKEVGRAGIRTFLLTRTFAARLGTRECCALTSAQPALSRWERVDHWCACGHTNISPDSYVRGAAGNPRVLGSTNNYPASTPRTCAAMRGDS